MFETILAFIGIFIFFFVVCRLLGIPIVPVIKGTVITIFIICVCIFLSFDIGGSSNGRRIGNFEYTISDYSFSRDKHADDNDPYNLIVWVKVENMVDYRGKMTEFYNVVDKYGKKYGCSCIFRHGVSFYRLEKRKEKMSGMTVPTNNASDYFVKIGDILIPL